MDSYRVSSFYSTKGMENRKKDHIELAFQSRTAHPENDPRFYYEPLLAPHPVNQFPTIPFLGKQLKHPIWISSMTGGTAHAGTINRNLAQACREFGLGMGLGSCRILLDSDEYLPDFAMRPVIGPDQPLVANLGIAQIENLLLLDQLHKVDELVEKLEADGIFIHINPFQEYFQPEGDRLRKAPIETLREVLPQLRSKVLVKEVGQGMGKESLRALLELPIAGIELAAFGGTNFAKLEMLRASEAYRELFEPFSKIGQTAEEMVDLLNTLFQEKAPAHKPEIILSGGIKSYLDGYYLMEKLTIPSIYGQASAFLKHATGDYSDLQAFAKAQIDGFRLAQNYLRIK